jgi:hypothetical protein
MSKRATRPGHAGHGMHSTAHSQTFATFVITRFCGSSFSSMDATSIVFMLWKLSAVEAFVSSTRNQSSD